MKMYAYIQKVIAAHFHYYSNLPIAFNPNMDVVYGIMNMSNNLVILRLIGDKILYDG